MVVVVSIPYTPRPMVGDGLTPLAFHLFDRVVQEEVDQDGVDSEVENRFGINQAEVGKFFCGHVLIFVVVVDLVRWRIPLLAQFRMAAFDLLSDEFDTPDADSSDFNLPCRPAFDRLQSSDVALQRWRVEQAAKLVEHLGNAVVFFIYVGNMSVELQQFSGREEQNTYRQTW